jgi:L-fuconolactonase
VRIDSHQHFWIYDPKEYPWITETVPVLKRDYMPDDLAPELKKAGLDGTVAVQARQTIDESRWLLNLADHYPIIKGVVGWVDLQSEKCGDDLAELAKHPKIRGVRHVVQDEPEDRFMVGEKFLRGLAKLREFKLTYDLLIVPKQLPAAIEVVKRVPEQPFVLDHIAKPFIRDGKISPWDTQMKELARHPNVMCKVSGMVTEAKLKQWKASDFKPYLDVVFEAFGEDRLMFGSDWPVCLLSGSYSEVFALIDDYLKSKPASAREKVLGGNAVRFYGLKP